MLYIVSTTDTLDVLITLSGIAYQAHATLQEHQNALSTVQERVNE